MSVISNPEMIDTVDIDEPHPDFICPISQDLMVNPVDIYHQGSTYTFDKNYVKTWWKTEGGDKNPLTMVEGFRGLEMKTNHLLAERIREFKIKTGQNPDREPEQIDLLPFSDFQQIQDDEQVAISLHRELNNSPTTTTTRPSIDDRLSNIFRYIFRMESSNNVFEPELINGRLHPLASNFVVSINNRSDIETLIPNNNNNIINIIRS